MTVNVKGFVFGLTVAAVLAIAASASAQVAPDIAKGLRKIGQIVDPAGTAKLYRPLMPANDFSTCWPPGAAAPVSRTLAGSVYVEVRRTFSACGRLWPLADLELDAVASRSSAMPSP